MIKNSVKNIIAQKLYNIVDLINILIIIIAQRAFGIVDLIDIQSTIIARRAFGIVAEWIQLLMVLPVGYTVF